MLSVNDPRHLTLHEAAARLEVSVEQMLAWNMVVIHEVDGREVVPIWSVDPLVARYMPTLSQVFQGEALTYVLATIRPMQDDRDGLTALREGCWREVLGTLQKLRKRFDRVMRDSCPFETAAYMNAANSPLITLH